MTSSPPRGEGTDGKTYFCHLTLHPQGKCVVLLPLSVTVGSIILSLMCWIDPLICQHYQILWERQYLSNFFHVFVGWIGLYLSAVRVRKDSKVTSSFDIKPQCLLCTSKINMRHKMSMSAYIYKIIRTCDSQVLFSAQVCPSTLIIQTISTAQ